MGTSQEEGFEITFDEKRSIIRLRLWGFWSPEIGQAMVTEFKTHVQYASTRGMPWYALADLSQFPPQTKGIQQCLSEAMQFARERGVRRTARVVASTITSLQISRLAQAAKIPEHTFFHSEEAAIQWLLRDESENVRDSE